MINVSKKSSTKINKIIHNNQHITDNKDIADTISNFYTNVGSSLEAKIPQPKKSFREYLGNSNHRPISLNECSLDEVVKLINNISISKACGPFSIPTKILKEFSNILSPIITVLVNKSLREGVFPKLLKSALVCPIYKKSDKTKCANYRPISLLSNLSKTSLCTGSQQATELGSMVHPNRTLNIWWLFSSASVSQLLKKTTKRRFQRSRRLL